MLCTLAHDELGTCRTSLVSPKQSVLFRCNPESWHPDLDWLEECLQSSDPPRMVVLVNPCNPTGNPCNPTDNLCNPAGNPCNPPHTPATLQVPLATLYITLQSCNPTGTPCNPTGTPAALQLPLHFPAVLLHAALVGQIMQVLYCTNICLV